MTSLLLALAITGQSCQLVNGRLVCPPTSPTKTSSSANATGWQRYVVRIQSTSPVNPRTGKRIIQWGSGVIVASDGQRALVLTNRHVVRGATMFAVHHQGRAIAATPVRIANDGDVAGLEITSPLRAMSIPIATEQSSEIVMKGWDPDGQTGETATYHEHFGRLLKENPDGTVEYSYGTHEGESGSPLINRKGELVGLVWGSNGRMSAAVGLAKLRGFVATETCFRFFRRGPRQINVNVKNPGTDPIPAIPTPVEPANPPAVTQPPQVVTVPTVTVPGATGPAGPMGPQGPAGTPGPPGAAAPATALPLIQMVTLKNGAVQLDSTGAPVQQFFRAVPGTDPVSGQPIMVYKVGLESDISLQTPTPTPVPPTPAK